MKTKVIVVEDHHIVREGIVRLLDGLNNIVVVAQASNGLDAITLCHEYQPDLVIMDVSMPKMRGTEAIAKIKDICPDTLILILSQYDQEEYIKYSLKNGASGYLLKQSAAEEMETALNKILNNQIYVSPEIANKVVIDWLNHADQNTKAIDQFLSNREVEVLKLIAEGHTNKEVAALLHISIKTVETHRARIMKKLELNTFADLIKYAIKSKLVE
jgi:two-component system, NarL family, response regulator NreC